MLTGLMLAAVSLGFVPAIEGIAVVVIHTQPVVALPAVALAVIRSRRASDRTSQPELIAAFLRSVAAELRAGRSLRVALVDSARLDPRLGLARIVRVAAAGRPMEQVADEMSTCPGMAGIATALRVAAMTGGSAVPVFESLAVDAADEAALVRERRELTVQARLSIAVVAGFPIAVLGYQVSSGQAMELVRQGSVGVGLLIVGVGLLGLGLGAVAILMRRARR
ncbi:MAG TPA: type II secretion system F family protein [Acidimicrobiia bacterium]|nr:type II secretion system F family protein [Acidimicrobiia bacterium]